MIYERFTYISRKPGARSACRIIEPKALPQGEFALKLEAQARAFGLIVDMGACALWGVTGCVPKEKVELAMWRLMGTLSAARCGLYATISNRHLLSTTCVREKHGNIPALAFTLIWHLLDEGSPFVASG